MTWPNYFEACGAHKELATVIMLRQNENECTICKKKHKRLSPIPVQPPGGIANKEDRILTFCQADFEDGKVYLHENDIKTKNQILQFPYGDMLDRFDALAYAINLSRRPHTIEEIEEFAKEKTVRELAQQRTSQTYEIGGYV
jgi:hypothetical protein